MTNQSRHDRFAGVSERRPYFRTVIVNGLNVAAAFSTTALVALSQPFVHSEIYGQIVPPM